MLFFSNNQGKHYEIKILFKKIGINILSPKDFKIKKEPKETGKSFAENAKIKSLFGFKKTKVPCFADDSGICIEALGWKPNIMSKNFIKKFKNNSDCFNYIISKTNRTGKYAAYFKSSICYTYKENYNIVFEGKVMGKISTQILGKNGFGYDAIFIPQGFSKTFAEMNSNEKNYLSHRAIAINKFINFITN